jgi:hypothetical protein
MSSGGRLEFASDETALSKARLIILSLTKAPLGRHVFPLQTRARHMLLFSSTRSTWVAAGDDMVQAIERWVWHTGPVPPQGQHL